jgi:uracil-DNA glycosylase
MDEEQSLEALRTAIAGCRICRDGPYLEARGPLPHEPRPVAVISSRARVLIAGQAPGLRVHESGLPFDDASGNRLRDWLGVDRDEFYDRDRFAIVPMGFCFPGYDLRGSDLPPRRNALPVGEKRSCPACRRSSSCWRSGSMRRPGIWVNADRRG